ncbi:MAG: glycosyltransferase family 39 protein [Acidimicrobiales bacterium]|jgi:4-amino-4-deoxy-L-arabinose transferase-like glycosyltransferase
MTPDSADRATIAGPLARTELFVLIVLTTASVIACFVDLGSRSLWNDEIHSALIATHHVGGLWSAVSADGGNMMLYYLLLHGVVTLFGYGQIALRVLSATAGAALTPVVFFLGRRMFGFRTAAIATALVAVSPALVVWDQQARGYVLGTLLITLSLLALLRAIERPSRPRWLLWGALVVLSLYTLVYAPMFLVPQCLALACWPQARRQLRPMLAVICVAGLAFVPLVVLLLRSPADNVLLTNPPPSTSESLHILEVLSLGAAPDLVVVTVLARVIAVAGLVCFIVAGTELLSRLRRGAADFETVCLGVLLSWLVVPLLVDTIFSLVYRSIFNSSFLLQSVPAGALTIAFVIGKLLPKAASNMTAVAFTALLLAALVPTYAVSYEQWAQASRYIAKAAQVGDCLTVNKPGLASNLGFYLSSEAPTTDKIRLAMPQMPWSEVMEPSFGGARANESFASVASQCRRLWIVISRATPGQYTLIDGEVFWFRQHGFTHLTASRFTPPYGYGINVVLLAR